MTRFLCLGIAAVGLSFDSSQAATLCGVGAVESAAGLRPYVAGDGALNGATLVLFQNAGVSESLATTDTAAAAAWLASLPSDGRDQAMGAVIQSMGSDPELARQTLDGWLQNPDRAGVIEDGRERGRGGSDRETAVNWSDPSLTIDPAFGAGSPAPVPEPATAFLGLLGMLTLLRRRYIKA